MQKLSSKQGTTESLNRRLAAVRAQLARWSAITDTSDWEASFFLDLIDQKNREIRRLKRLL